MPADHDDRNRPQPQIVVTCEGLSPAALSCYGSSWNHTPTIDSIAGCGFVWDRCLVDRDDPNAVLRDLAGRMLAGRGGGTGSIELITDGSTLDPRIGQLGFDRIELMDDPIEPPDCPCEDAIDTRLGRLFAAAIERDSRPEPWQLLWIHSGFLSRCWDAPRDGLTALLNEDEPLPDDVLADRLTPPHIQLSGGEHPDTVSGWMRVYGVQVQLIDELLELLFSAMAARDPKIVIAGTSGFRLGQQSWIGHHAGPLRYRDLHVPMIASAQRPVRFSKLSSITAAVDTVCQTALPDAWLQRWKHQSELPPITVASDRAKRNLITNDWFYVQDLDDTQHLFLKPDDSEDFNDVARLRPDIVWQLEQQQNAIQGHEKNPAGP
jgi:hypothetical protein